MVDYRAQSDNTGNVVPFRAMTALQYKTASELVLTDCDSAQLELLVGTLQFLNGCSNAWITWVMPPQAGRTLAARKDLQTSRIRFLYEDQKRSVFHLLYLAVQAANSSWVIGPAQELSFREQRLLEQAAQQHGCRLLLIRQQNPVH